MSNGEVVGLGLLCQLSRGLWRLWLGCGPVELGLVEG